MTEQSAEIQQDIQTQGTNNTTADVVADNEAQESAGFDLFSSQAAGGDKKTPEPKGDKDGGAGDESPKKTDTKEVVGGDEEPPASLKELEEKAKSETEAIERFWKRVNAAIPGAREIVSSSEFGEWLDAQAKEMQGLANSNDPEDGMFVLREYDRFLKNKDAPGKDADGSGKNDPVRAQEFLTSLGLDKIDLTDGKDGGAKMNFLQFAKQYPEVIQSQLHIATKIAEGAIKAALEKAGIVSQKDIESLVKEKIQPLSFRDSVRSRIGDFDSIVQSSGFVEWLEKQSEFVKKLWKGGAVEDVAGVIGAYKEVLDKASVRNREDKVLAEKRRRDAIHTHALKEQKTGSAGGRAESEEEMADRGWELGLQVMRNQ